MNRAAAFALAGTLALTVTSCASSNAPATDDGNGPIRIGASLDITGTGASLGTLSRDALELEVANVNAKGGVKGRKVELIIEDNKSENDVAAERTTKLIKENKVHAIIGTNRVATTMASSSVAEEAKIPMVSLAAAKRVLLNKDGQPLKYLFKTAPNDGVMLERMLDHLVARGYKTVGLMRDDGAYGEGIQEQFDKLGEEHGIRIVETQKFSGKGGQDLTEQAAKIKAAKPDAVIIWGIPPVAGTAQIALRAALPDVPVLQSPGVGNKAFIASLSGTSKDASGGDTTPTGATTPSDTASATDRGDAPSPRKVASRMIAIVSKIIVPQDVPEGDPQAAVISEFTRTYKEKYNRAPSAFDAFARDALHLILDSAASANSTNPEKLHDAMEHFDKPGTGGVFHMAPDDHSGLSKDALTFAVIEDGQWRRATK